MSIIFAFVNINVNTKYGTTNPEKEKIRKAYG